VSAQPVRWYAHPRLAGVRLVQLAFGTQLELGTADAAVPPGEPGEPIGTPCTWCRLVGSPGEWPYQGWFRLPGPLDGWSAQVTRLGGLVPDALQAAYWRAYAQALEAHLRDQATVLPPDQDDEPWT
jgi:hypothetical protein